MGYNCKIMTDKNIKISDVQNIIDELPEYLSRLGNSKQQWGWSCYCDVYKPTRKSLEIGGSYSISGEYKDKFVDYIKNGLIEKGYSITKVSEN